MVQLSDTNKKRNKNSKPLTGPPPGKLPCKPTLLLGIPDWAIEKLSHILINDLVYSSTSRYREMDPVNAGPKLESLSGLDGKTLLKMTREYGGTCILPEDEVYDKAGEVDKKKLKKLNGKYQAIVVDDTCFIREPCISDFVSRKYREEGISVVIMALEGIFNLSPLNNTFNVNWNLVASSTCTIRLTDAGERVIGATAFPWENKYVKANFVHGGHGEEMFMEHQHLEDYEDEEDYPDGPPPLKPGSPVVIKIENNKSVSYFGFVNSMDVSFGAITLRLCYAASHPYVHVEGASPDQEQKQKQSQHTSPKKKKLALEKSTPGNKSICQANVIIVAVLAFLAFLYLLPHE